MKLFHKNKINKLIIILGSGLLIGFIIGVNCMFSQIGIPGVGLSVSHSAEMEDSFNKYNAGDVSYY